MQQNHELTDQIRVSSQAQQVQELLPSTIGQYKFGKTLGKGTFGKVKQAIHIPTNQKVAIKIIDKNTIEDEDDKDRILRQVQIMKISRHPNIINLYEIIETQSKIFLVLQFAQQGQLFKLMSNQGRLKQRAAGRIFLQILNAVQYLHRLDIVHRDLKPENILLDVDFNIKLIDYGLSNYHQEGKKLSTACGSPCYAPPQMLSGNDYDGKIGDVWSLGIIFYGMICGSLPFQQQNTKDLYKRVIQGFYYIPNDISIQSIQVIQKMLVTDPTRRVTISQIRKMRFFRQITKIQPQIIGIIVGFHPMPIDNEILDKMQQICPRPKDEIQFMIKQNQHNQFTTIYYLIQKQVLRQGGKTIVDLQIFLETHQKYAEQYGKQSLTKYYKQIGKIQEKKQQRKLLLKSDGNKPSPDKFVTDKKQNSKLSNKSQLITPRRSQLETTKQIPQKNKIQRKGLSKQKYNKNQFKQQNPLKFFSNQRINRKLLSSLDAKNLKKLTSKAKVQQKNETPKPMEKQKQREKYHIKSLSKTKNHHQQKQLEKTQRINTVQTARSNLSDKFDKFQTQRKERSKSRSVSTKLKRNKLKSPGKNLAINLWNAYFQDPLQKKLQKQKKQQKKRRINPKQQQRIQTFDLNVKKLKQGFLQLPQMQKTKRINLKKDQTISQNSALQATKKIQKYHTTVSDMQK